MCVCMCMYMIATSISLSPIPLSTTETKNKKTNTLPDDSFRLAELCNPINGPFFSLCFLIVFLPSLPPFILILILISILYVVS